MFLVLTFTFPMVKKVSVKRQPLAEAAPGKKIKRTD